MHSIYICLAGPQSSGKTKALKILSKKFKNIRPHSEINPFVMTNNNHLGGVFVDGSLERKIIKADIKRLAWLTQARKREIHLVETGLFHLVYAQEKLKDEELEEFKNQYQNSLKRFNVGTLFIDTKPQISWARRRGYYLKRTRAEIKRRRLNGVEAKKFREKMMKKYKNRIFALYPLWLKTYSSLPYSKVKISNNSKSLPAFEKKVVDGFLRLVRKMKVSVGV